MNQFEQVKEKADILQIFEQLGGKIGRRKYGEQINVHCPFHDDKTASMSINTSEKIYYCHGCSEKGDIFDLYSKMKNISKFIGLTELANIYGIEIENDDNSIEHPSKRRIIDIYNSITEIGAKNIQKPGVLGREYLLSRGINDDTLKQLLIGYIDDDVDLYDELKSIGYTHDDIIRTGLFGGSKKFALNNRVIIPVLNGIKNTVMFTGRSIDNSIPKYKNSVNGIIGKSDILYNLQNHHGNQKYKILVEGPMDAIALFNEGKKNALAIMGKDISEIQCNIMADYADNVIIWLDNDKSSVVYSAYNTYVKLRNRGINVKFVLLDGDFDPHEFLQQKSASNIKKYIISFGEYFRRTIHMLINENDIFYIEELQKIFQEYVYHMNYVDRYEVKSYLEDKYVCHLQLKNDIAYEEMSLSSIGFKKHNEYKDIFYLELDGYIFYLLKKGQSYRLLNKKIVNDKLSIDQILYDILINDNQVIFSIANIAKLKEYLTQI